MELENRLLICLHEIKNMKCFITAANSYLETEALLLVSGALLLVSGSLLLVSGAL